MFVPIDRKPDWQNPPVITLLLILANILCYTIWQYDDDLRINEAYEYYFRSDLLGFEFPRYINFLQKSGDQEIATKLQKELDLEPLSGRILTFQSLMGDGKFLTQLRNNEIILPTNPIYSNWRAQRDYFDSLLNTVVSYKFALLSIDVSILTLFTHMFLHADFGHLLGNMVFLFIFGFVLEIALGRSIYLGAYLLAGMASGIFYVLIEPHSGNYAIGASGAVSGLVGMYTVVYGMRKIRFFYFLLFYFNYVKAPAIVLLPLWLSYELYYQIFSPSYVNNLAHIGGLIGGAGVAFLAKRYTSTIDYTYLEEHEKEEGYQKKFKQGLQHVAALEFDKAKTIFNYLLEERSDDLEAVLQLYNIAKFDPSSEEYHLRAQQLMKWHGSDIQTTKMLHKIYGEYIVNAKPRAKLNLELLFSIALRFSANNYLEEAEKIVSYLLKKKPDFIRNSEVLLALIKNHARNKNMNKSKELFDTLVRYYPESVETQHAKRLIAQDIAK